MLKPIKFLLNTRLNTQLYYNLFDQHPWCLRKNNKLLKKLKKSSVDKEFIDLVKRQNVFIMFKLLVNRFRYDTYNTFYLPMELWNIIETPLVQEITDEFTKYQDVMYNRWYEVDPIAQWSRLDLDPKQAKYVYLRRFTSPNIFSHKKQSWSCSVMQLIIPNDIKPFKCPNKKITGWDIHIDKITNGGQSKWMKKTIKSQEVHIYKQNKYNQKKFIQKHSKQSKQSKQSKNNHRLVKNHKQN